LLGNSFANTRNVLSHRERPYTGSNGRIIGKGCFLAGPCGGDVTGAAAMAKEKLLSQLILTMAEAKRFFRNAEVREHHPLEAVARRLGEGRDRGTSIL
jgi:hypothetical protein